MNEKSMFHGANAAGTALKPVARTAQANHADDLPASLIDVALIDARQCARAAGVSLSTWYDLVKDGRAPQPAFRAVRCTRWRLADVRSWLIEFARTGIAGRE